MSAVLITIAFVALFVIATAILLAAAHRVLRPHEMNARSATALRELEPRGGRHRFHVRLFEVIALSCACMTALGVLFVAAATPGDASTFPGPMVLAIGGAAIVVAVWWAWRRGALRAVETDASHARPVPTRAIP